MSKDSGRAPSGQALVASDQAASRLDPSGFDPSRDDEEIAWDWVCDYAERTWSEVPEDCSFEATQMVDAFLAGADAGGARVQAVLGLLERARDFLAGTHFESGVCCCGELISDHDPYHSNHAPRDDIAYQATTLCARPASAIEAATAGETTEIGSTEGESAAREAGDAQ